MIKVGFVFLLILGFSVNYTCAQELYNSCSTALEVCPNSTFNLNNVDANVTFCAGCEDDFNFCFTPQNTIWLTFTTNTTGGDVTLNFSNLNFNISPGQDVEVQAVIIEASIPCNSASYTQVGNCISNGAAPFSLNAISLPPNTKYYIVVDGNNTGPGIASAAECTFDLSITGMGVSRPTPTVNLFASSNSICLNDVVFFEATLTDCPNNSSYSWSVNGEIVAVTESNVFSTSALIDGDVLTVENSCFTSCLEFVTANSPAISVYSFNIEAGANQSTTPGAAVSVSGVTSGPIHVWEPAFLFSNPLALNTLLFPEETTTITLTVTENGCTLSDYLTVTISEGLIIPSILSPNGDNVNDLWVIEGLDKYPDNSIYIYDRWGQKVFQSRSYSVIKAWDGRVRSGVVSEGVFYYVLELNDKNNQQYKGSITVIR